MSILVTGGAGYIGGTVASYLAGKGENVVILDNLEKSWQEPEGGRCVFYKGDIADKDLVAGIAAKHNIKECMHFASFIDAGESVADPFKYFRNNTCRALSLFEMLKEANVKNIVFSSTAAVYGEPEYSPIDEDHPKNPVNPYGMSKLFTENILDSMDKAYGIRHVALRYFNACGALGRGEDHDPETHLIPLVLQVPLGIREYVAIYGDDYGTRDGTCLRDYVHVEDLASAHYLALLYLRGCGKSEKINLGCGKGFSVREVINVGKKVTGVNIPEKICPRRPGDPSVLIASNKKAKEVLGWEPSVSDLEDMVASAWNWHRSYHGALKNNEF